MIFLGQNALKAARKASFILVLDECMKGVHHPKYKLRSIHIEFIIVILFRLDYGI